MRVVQILNETDNKAQFIVNAVLQYIGESDNSQTTRFDMDTMQSVVAALVKQEVQKAMKLYGVSDNILPNNVEGERVFDLTDNLEPMPENKELAKHVLDAMSAFRKI